MFDAHRNGANELMSVKIFLLTCVCARPTPNIPKELVETKTNIYWNVVSVMKAYASSQTGINVFRSINFKT